MTKLIKILDLRDSPWVDGPGRTILDCADSLKNDGYHFIIGAFSGGVQKTSEYAEEAERRGLCTLSIKEKSAFDLNVIKQIFEIIDNNEIDIIHTHDFRSNIFGLYCAKRRGKPVVSTVHGWIANDYKGRIYTLIDKFILRFFNRVISVSKRTSGLVIKSGIKPSKNSIINNALKLENYIKNINDKSFREEIGCSDATVIIINVGRLSPEKGQMDFLKAGREVVKQNTNIKFVIIGIGPDQEELENFVNDNNMKDVVYFAGFRKDMVSIYNSADLVVQSSYTEGMPNVIIEALAMQVPVIATDVGGTSEVVDDGRAGVLIQAGNVNQLSDEVVKFIENKDDYCSMVAKGYEYIHMNFNHETRAQHLSKIYMSLLNMRDS